jgi:MYXO-CTERM domain-containing protein
MQSNKKQFLASAICAAVAALGATGVARALPVDQFADSVVGFTSEYTTSSWSAAQALGAPNTTTYGDIVTAWAPRPRNGSIEQITLGFSQGVYAEGISIWETWGNGFVRTIELLEADGTSHTIFAGVDPSLPGAPVEFSNNFARTAYIVNAVRITTDTNHNLATWEEIDAVQLRGNTTAPDNPVPVPGIVGLLAVGALALRRAQRNA